MPSTGAWISPVWENEELSMGVLGAETSPTEEATEGI